MCNTYYINRTPPIGIQKRPMGKLMTVKVESEGRENKPGEEIWGNERALNNHTLHFITLELLSLLSKVSLLTAL